MRILLLILLLPAGLAAQTIREKSMPYTKGQKVNVSFDYPELIMVSTWEKNEVYVKASVSINGGENDDAFQLDASGTGNVIEIGNKLSLDGIPHRLTVNVGGQKTTFSSRAAWKKYKEENSLSDYNTSEGVDLDITIEVKVPAGADTKVHATYGMVEVKDFSGPLVVEATYGGVDALVTSVGKVEAETRYGHIYSDPSIQFKTDPYGNEDFHTSVTASVGSGPDFHLESSYGNVYIRKSAYQKKSNH
ncbi:MAG: hypothetical protein JST14_11255 [Bacteroidetes bacterium]|nr:hypothetical protein [Bacteroidota bacterium]